MQLSSRVAEDMAHWIDAMDDGPSWIDECLEHLKLAVGAETAAAFQISAGDRHVCGTRYRHHDLFGDAFLKYSDHYVFQDPLIERAASNLRRNPGQRTQQFYKLSDYLSSSFQSKEYYGSFLRPLDIHHKLAFFIAPKANPTNLFAFGFHRPRLTSDFGEEEMMFFRRILPVLTEKLDYYALQEVAAERESIIDILDAERPGPIVVLDDFGTMVFSNREAKEEFRSLDGNDKNLSQVQDLIRSLAARKNSITDEMTFDVVVGDKRLSLRADRRGYGKELYVVSANHSQEESLKTKFAALKISAREAEVVKFLAKGLANIEIGDRLGISRRTVENHIRSIYAKAGVRSRTQLIQKVLLNG